MHPATETHILCTLDTLEQCIRSIRSALLAGKEESPEALRAAEKRLDPIGGGISYASTEEEEALGRVMADFLKSETLQPLAVEG